GLGGLAGVGGQLRQVRPAGHRPNDVRLRLPELGREPAVPRACLRRDPSWAGADLQGRRDELHVRDQRYCRRGGAGAGGRGRQGRPAGRRGQRRPAGAGRGAGGRGRAARGAEAGGAGSSAVRRWRGGSALCREHRGRGSSPPALRGAVIADGRVRKCEWRDWSRVWHYPAGGRLMSVADDPLYPYRLDALEQTWQVWSQLGGSLSETQWSAASRCPGWDVACLYAHHSQLLLALSGPPPHAPEVSGQPQSAVQVLRAFNAPGGVASTAAPAVADQAAREAAQHKPAELAERFTGLGPVIIRRLRTARPDLV